MSRAATAFEISCGGVPPAETVTGVVCISSRRTSESGVFVSVEFSVPVSVKSALGQIAFSDSRSGLVLRLLCSRNNSLWFLSFC